MKAAAKSYFGKTARRADPRPDRDPRRDPPVADEVRPRQERRGGLPRVEVAEGAECPTTRSSSSSRRLRDRQAPQLRPRPDEDPQPAHRGQAHRRRVRGGQGGAGRPRRSRSSATGGRPTSSGRSASELGQILCPDDAGRRLRRRSTPAATGSRRRSTGRCRRREKWIFAAARAPNAKDPRAVLEACKIPTRGLELDPRPARPATSTTARPRSSTTGPARSSPTSGQRELHGQGNKKFQPQFDVLSDGWRQPGSAIKPINYAIGIEDQTMTAATMFMDVVDRLRRRVHPDPGRQARARPGPPPLGAPVLAEHPGDQGRPDERPRPLLRARPRTSASDATRARPSRSSRWASARSRSTRSTCSAPTARSPTAAC